MRRLVSLVVVAAVLSLVSLGCSQASPAPAPTKAPEPPKAAAPATTAPATAAAATKAPEATKPAAATVPATAAPAASKTNFPEAGKTITVIVAYPAGGGTDVTARLLAPMLEKDLGVPVTVANKGGAGGQIGFTELAQSKPDGYTIGPLILPTVITTYLDSERKAVFGPNSFQLLALQDIDPGIIAVKVDSPYKTLKELVDAAKAKPDTIKVSDSGIMSDDHLNALKLGQVSGAKFNVVHFDGSAPGRTAVLGGHVDAFFGNQSEVAAQVKNGEFRILAITDTQRSKFYPDVPTAEQAGYKVLSGVHRGIGMPAGAPKEVVDKLTASIKKTINSDDFKKKMDEMTYQVNYMDPDQYSSFWKQYEQDIKPMVELAKKAG